jgi:hypothetical protein
MAEQDCGQKHYSIEEAIAHAKQNLGGNLTEPVWGKRGGRIANVGWVIGYQSADGQKRFRLDYEERDARHPVPKGVHVNEEDRTRAVSQQKVCHLVLLAATPKDTEAEDAWRKAREGKMQLFWHKWTSRYDKPADVLEAEQEVDRLQRLR